MEQRKRVLVAKPGLDGHDLGARLICHVLKDAGFEVIYTGLRQTVEQIAQTALQEDVDIVGLSVLSGAHLGLTQKIMNLLEAKGLKETKVVVGGLILTEDIPRLKELGVAEVFPSATPLDEIAERMNAI